jgi:hypothetical protein
MNAAIRIVATLVSCAATFFFVFWCVISLTFSLHPGAFRSSLWMGELSAFLVAVAVGWYVWAHTASSPARLVNSALLGALVAGAIGFAAGFFGPLLFTPSGRANVGPVFGFITGPLGFILGAVVGAAYWFVRWERAGEASGEVDRR